MLSRIRTVLAGAACLIATSAMAQGAPPSSASLASGPQTTVRSVTVQAPPLTHAEALKRSRGFVQSYAATTARLDQLARWSGPVCVLVLGLPPEQGATVSARIEDVAKAVGLKVDPAGCNANIQVVFSDDPQHVLDWAAGRSDWILGFHYGSETAKVKTVNRPVQAWYMTATVGGAGDNSAAAFASTSLAGSGVPHATRGTEGVDRPQNGTPTGCANSRFTSCLQSVFKNVLVVVDNRRVQGRPLGPLADYLAMLALSQPRSLDGCTALPSVIDLLAPAACRGGPAPDGLTPADAAYLTALYAGDPEAKKSRQQSEIAERMAGMLVKASPAAR